MNTLRSKKTLVWHRKSSTRSVDPAAARTSPRDMRDDRTHRTCYNRNRWSSTAFCEVLCRCITCRVIRHGRECSKADSLEECSFRSASTQEVDLLIDCACSTQMDSNSCLHKSMHPLPDAAALRFFLPGTDLLQCRILLLFVVSPFWFGAMILDINAILLSNIVLLCCNARNRSPLQL